MRRKMILSAIFAVAITANAAATEHYAISAGSVATTLKGSGVTVSPDQVSFPAEVLATTPTPLLKLRSVERLTDERMLARLECVNSGECLPFFVEVHAGQGSVIEAARVARATMLSAGTSQTATTGTTVRSGSAVTLMLDGAHVHIRIPAICLQGGAPGQLIRVTDTNHRLIYAAEVVNASVVKGKLR
jgi:hypothetical protein